MKKINMNSTELYDEVKRVILDRDFDDLETELFGSPAVECLELSPESLAVVPQGSPFLKYAKRLSDILKPYKGVYGIK